MKKGDCILLVVTSQCSYSKAILLRRIEVHGLYVIEPTMDFSKSNPSAVNFVIQKNINSVKDNSIFLQFSNFFFYRN